MTLDNDTAAPSVDVFDILFPLEKSIRYHQRRRAFYDGWHRWLMFAIIVAGSTSVTDVLSGHEKIMALLTAVLGAIDLVFALPDKARDHEFLLRRFSSMVGTIRQSQSPTQQDIDRWRAERVEIEADEPAVYWALEAACYNEATRAFDRDPNAEVYVPLFYRLTKNYMRFDPTRFRTLGQIKSIPKAA